MNTGYYTIHAPCRCDTVNVHCFTETTRFWMTIALFIMMFSNDIYKGLSYCFNACRIRRGPRGYEEIREDELYDDSDDDDDEDISKEIHKKMFKSTLEQISKSENNNEYPFEEGGDDLSPTHFDSRNKKDEDVINDGDDIVEGILRADSKGLKESNTSSQTSLFGLFGRNNSTSK
jgi:hypothetical protein